MAIGLHEVPRDGAGHLPMGKWHMELVDPSNVNFAQAQFIDGRTTRPVDGRTLVRFVASMGRRIRGAVRVEDGRVLGEGVSFSVATLKPMQAAERLRGLYDRATKLAESGVPLGADLPPFEELLESFLEHVEPEDRTARLDELEAELNAIVAEESELDALAVAATPGEPVAPEESGSGVHLHTYESETNMVCTSCGEAAGDEANIELPLIGVAEGDTASDDTPLLDASVLRETQIGVTPPESDTPAMREWLEREARRGGYTDLRWEDGIDKWGKPMGTLFGVKQAVIEPIGRGDEPTSKQKSTRGKSRKGR